MNFLWVLSKKLKKKLQILYSYSWLSCYAAAQETLLKSDFDIVLKSTNLDFVLLELCNELNKKNFVLDNIITKGITYKKIFQMMK